ncbi:MAG TPA: EutN/CcmL family microcompartment protein [Opitutales bacterium]|jgi:microcompartment protein CcmK/EutM|nr:EutN/CcmL family microcompartment protein [Opitutales bacterium]
MRLATVIGRVTLSVRHPSLKGERLLVALPWGPKTPQTGKDHDYSIVVYDQLGANVGQTVGVCESTEATRPFEKPTPVDAYCAALIDTVFYQPEDPRGA